MKVFIAGPRAIRKLDVRVEEKLGNICHKNYTVLVGDADGVDSAVQRYFSDHQYRNVIVFACEGKARNNIGNWDVRNIAIPKKLRGFDYYAVKDKAMSVDADCGFMIWNGESRGTLNNIINLRNADKMPVVYLTKTKLFYKIDSAEKLQELLAVCEQSTRVVYERLNKQPVVTSPFHQESLF